MIWHTEFQLNCPETLYFSILCPSKYSSYYYCLIALLFSTFSKIHGHAPISIRVYWSPYFIISFRIQHILSRFPMPNSSHLIIHFNAPNIDSHIRSKFRISFWLRNNRRTHNWCTDSFVCHTNSLEMKLDTNYQCQASDLRHMASFLNNKFKNKMFQNCWKSFISKKLKKFCSIYFLFSNFFLLWTTHQFWLVPLL